MAVLIANGCFDLLHEGHKQFLIGAKRLGISRVWAPEDRDRMGLTHHMIVAINSDASARKLKGEKWGASYPIDDQNTRAMKLRHYADEVFIFNTEDQLEALIAAHMPCIICKGPDYAGKRVTGDEIAPVIILDTPETQEIRQFKQKAYAVGQR
jgi:D-beta-D-heptose 7-phosphate kinase/D-beta-D-heptose 1-phosphate adenosyltransferase